MKRVEIDFLPRRRPKPWMWKAVAVLWALAITLFAVAWQQRAEVARLRAQIENQRDEAARMSGPAPPRTPPYEASARQMLREKLSPWPQALAALERTDFPGIQIVAVDISTPEQRIRVEVQFSDLGEVLKYIAELNLGEPSPRWTLEQTSTASISAGVSTAVINGSLLVK